MNSSALALVLMFLAATAPPEPLRFRDFFEPGPRELRLSARLRSLEGRRVRMVGFMADAELAPRGGFYLCPFPVAATEAGGGTADLPPETVFVVVRAARGAELAHRSGPLEVTGLLELGGSGWPIRIELETQPDHGVGAGPGEPAPPQPQPRPRPKALPRSSR